jgi:hypothetical protein
MNIMKTMKRPRLEPTPPPDRFPKPGGPNMREQRFKDWYGWRPIRNSRSAICPRRVAGKRCLRHTGGRGWPECICVYQGGLLDHKAMWKDESGNLLFTTEPYHCAADELAAFSGDLVKLGLEAEVLPRSGWYPGSTILIVVRKAASVAVCEI